MSVYDRPIASPTNKKQFTKADKVQIKWQSHAQKGLTYLITYGANHKETREQTTEQPKGILGNESLPSAHMVACHALWKCRASKMN